MTGTPTFTLVNMCGNEGAQVVAARLPFLLRKVVPGTSLRAAAAACETPVDLLPDATDAYIVMLPPETLRARSAWHRFKRSLGSPAQVLPVVVGDVDCRTRPYGCRSGIGGGIVQEASEQTEHRRDTHPSRSGLRALPIVHIPPGDARIEHGGRFHLDADASALLVSRLQDLTNLSRNAAAGSAALPADTDCRCGLRLQE